MHLLLVEDDQRLARVLRRLLEDDRHVVEVAHDGETGVGIANSAAGIEVVVLDVGLPDISGLEVARRVRKAGGEMAILMLTARDTVNDRVTGLDAGADDYLVKPFAFEELSARLRALARRRACRRGSGRRNRPRALDCEVDRRAARGLDRRDQSGGRWRAIRGPPAGGLARVDLGCPGWFVAPR